MWENELNLSHLIENQLVITIAKDSGSLIVGPNMLFTLAYSAYALGATIFVHKCELGR